MRAAHLASSSASDRLKFDGRGRATFFCNSHTSTKIIDTLDSNYRIRRLVAADVEQTAALCLDAFGPPDDRLSLTSRPRTQAQWMLQLSNALERTLHARQEARLYRLTTQANLLRTQLASLDPNNLPNGMIPPLPKPLHSPKELRKLAAWRRKRTFCHMVVEEKSTGEVAGCVAVSLATPEAALPPPFPTRAPQRCYVSNMAVSPKHRRRGLASTLLLRCERLARAWRQDSIWLHVDNGNDAARDLYESKGYRESHVRGFWGSERRGLLRKDLEPLPCFLKERKEGSIRGEIGVDGVFVWTFDPGAAVVEENKLPEPPQDIGIKN